MRDSQESIHPWIYETHVQLEHLFSRKRFNEPVVEIKNVHELDIVETILHGLGQTQCTN